MNVEGDADLLESADILVFVISLFILPAIIITVTQCYPDEVVI